jgi:hypothetical protein
MADSNASASSQEMPATEPLDKDAVNYRKGEGPTSCASCRYFTAPSQCRLVKGPVEAAMLCDLYAPSEEQRGQMEANMFGGGAPMAGGPIAPQ